MLRWWPFASSSDTIISASGRVELRSVFRESVEC
ncbi:unnamed protein product [Rhodiola kirilowii]